METRDPEASASGLIVKRANPYARILVVLFVLAAALVGLVYNADRLSAWRVPLAYALPFLLAAAVIWTLILCRQGAGRVPGWPLAGGLFLVLGGAAFDMIITVIKSPDLAREANPIARTLLDSGHALWFVYVYGVVAQGLLAACGCLLWVALLRHGQTVIEFAREFRPRTWWQFYKAATGGGALSWRQYFLPLKLADRPYSYHVIMLMAGAWLGGSLYRWYLGLRWLGFLVEFKNAVLVLSVLVGFFGYVIWLWREYRKGLSPLRVFRGAVAIVTGGASGIGRGLAEELAKRGAEVILADRQLELARAVAAGIAAAGGRARAEELDVRDAAAVERVVQAVVERSGRLDFMFNNAGIGVFAEVRDHTLDDWNEILDVNVRGVIHGVNAAYPVMRRQGFGHIVSTASIAGFSVCPLLASYAATKYAVIGLSLALRVEAAPLGVWVSVVTPGLVRTPIIDGGKYGRMKIDIPEEFKERVKHKLGAVDPNVFARRVLKAVARNRALIVVPGWYRLVWWLNRFFPGLALWLSKQQYRQAKNLLNLEEK